MDTQENVGKAVRRARLASGMSQEQLAATAGLDRTYISGMERGKRNPTLSTLKRIADALGTTMAELLSDAERRT